MDRTVEILLVKGSGIDEELVGKALGKFEINNKLHVLNNGEGALDFLYRKGKYKSSPTPDLIILDLNLPQKDGREVLIEVKYDDELRLIPMIVLTDPENERDIKMAYGHYKNCYIGSFNDIGQVLEIAIVDGMGT